MGVSFEEPEVISEGRKDVRRIPCKFCEQQLADCGGTTCTVIRLLSLITRRSSRTVLIFNKPNGRCTSVISVVLLVVGVEKKTCPISRFYDRSDRQPTGLLVFIRSGDNYVIIRGISDCI